MPLVAVGVILLLAKLAEFGPVANWPWWAVLAPFGAAVVWWAFADSTGWTQRKAIEKMEQRKVDRRNRALEALGQDTRKRRQAEAREPAAAAPSTPRKTADPTQVDHDD